MTIMEEYFNAIGIKEPIKKRVNELVTKIKAIYPNFDIIDVAVNEYIQKDGSRKFESIRFYSEDISIKVDDFTEDNYSFKIARSHKEIDAIRIDAKNYDFVKANDNSRLTIIAQFMNMRYTDLKGSGANCDYLFEIFKKYVQPRLLLKQHK